MTPAADPIRESSRDRVLAVLRAAAQPVGISDVSAATGLSPTAARFHLDHLIGLGAVHASKDPSSSGSGRPALLYTAAPAEAVDPAAAYRALARLLAVELERSAGSRAATEAGRAWAASLLKGRDLEDAVALPLVLSLLTDGGFNPVLSVDGSTVELHRCPFLDLALEQPAVVCGVHLGLVTGVLDAIGSDATVRLVPDLDGDGPCLVRFSVPGKTSASSTEVPTIEEHVT